MQHGPNNTSEIDEKIIKDRDLIVASLRSRSANREPANAAPVGRSTDRATGWKQSIAGISIGLGMTMLATIAIDYPRQSIAFPVTFKPSPAKYAARQVAALTTPNRALIAVSTGSDRHREAATAPDRLEQAQTAVKEAKIAIALSQADVTQAELNLQTFKTDYDRDRDLYRSGTIDRQKLARTSKIYDFAKAQKGRARDGLQQAQAQLIDAELGVDRLRVRSQSICLRSPGSAL
jgi:hypothetical protein